MADSFSPSRGASALEQVIQEMRQIVADEVAVHCGNEQACLDSGWVGMSVAAIKAWADQVEAALAARVAPREAPDGEP